MKKGVFKPEYLAAAACALVLVLLLMVRPITGVADNGDFPRIMGSTGLQYMTSDYKDRYFGYVNRLYRVGFGIPAGGGYLSTEVPVVITAVILSQLVKNSWVFDIRYLSLLYSLVFLFSIFLIIRAVRTKSKPAGWMLAVMTVLVFADTGYISYFNSLYGEAVSLVALLLAAGAGLCLVYTEKPRLWALICFFTGVFLLAGAKLQNVPIGLLGALFGLRLLGLGYQKAWRRAVFISAAAVAAVSLITFFSVSRDIKVCNKYQSVFYGVLKDSPDPAGDLKELGLDPGLAVLAGTNYFMDSYPVDIRSTAFKNALYEKVGPAKVALFYVKHPDRLLGKLEVAAQNGFKLRQGFGNYEKYEGVAYKQTANTFGLWSDFKALILPHSLFFVALFFAAFFVTAAIEYIRCRSLKQRLAIELLAIVGLMGGLQLVVPVIGDGEADISKHLFLFNVCFDMIFVAGAAYIVHRVRGLFLLAMNNWRGSYDGKDL